MLTPVTTALFSSAGMLSADGRCKTLSAAADGYGRGEACVTLVLQLHGSDIADDLSVGSRASGSGGVIGLTAQAGGANQQGALMVLKGTAVGQDGRSSSLTAPNGPAQQAVISAALLEATLHGQARTICCAHCCGMVGSHCLLG